jgi:hypothetical protein
MQAWTAAGLFQDARKHDGALVGEKHGADASLEFNEENPAPILLDGFGHGADARKESFAKPLGKIFTKAAVIDEVLAGRSGLKRSAVTNYRLQHGCCLASRLRSHARKSAII